MSDPPPGVTSLRARGRVVMSLLGAQAAWSLVTVATTLSEIDLLERIRDGALVTQGEADASDARVRSVAVVALSLLIVTIVAWLIWQHRGQRNLVRLGVRQLGFTPGWAVGWWFVPIANLWKPFQAIRELWRSSRPDVDDSFWAGERTWAVIGWWWGLLIAASIATRISGAMVRLETIDSYIGSDRVDLVREACWIGAAILGLLVVRSITGRQEQKIAAGPVVPPRPDAERGWRS